VNSRTNFIRHSSFCIVIALFFVVVPSISINGIDNGVGLNSPRTVLTQRQQPQANLNSVEEQQQLMEGISFQINNLTFSHHMATVNGIQLHYVMGGEGDPVVLCMVGLKHGTNGVMLCQLWPKIILL
jgi:hypothetical protein